jgi:hypothetical protein
LPEAEEAALPDEPTRNVRLRYVPLPLAGNRRHQWQTLLVLSALSKCRASSATVQQLHTLVWALSDELNAESLKRAWATPSARIIRGYVPDLLQILRIMQVESLVNQEASGRQKLTPLGQNVLSAFAEHGGQIGKAETLLDALGPFSTTGMARNLGGSFS